MAHFEYAEIIRIGLPELYSTDDDLLVRAAELIRKQGYGTELNKLPSGQLYEVRATGKIFDVERHQIVNTLLLKLMLEDGWEPFAIKPNCNGGAKTTVFRRAYTKS